MVELLTDFAPTQIERGSSLIPREKSLSHRKREKIQDTMEEAAMQQLPLDGFKPSRPNLYSAAVYRTIRSSERVHEVGAKMQSTLSLDLDRLQTKIAELNQERNEKLKETTKKTQESDIWSYLQTIGSYILAAWNTVFGFTLFSSGGTVTGALLIGAGLVSIANEAMTYMGAWDWVASEIAGDNEELCQFLTAFLPSACACVTTSLSFYGLKEAQAIWNQLDFAAKALLVFEVAMGFSQGVIGIGKGVSDYGVAMSKIDTLTIQQALVRSEKELDHLMIDMERVMQIMSRSTEHAKKIIQLAIQSNKQVNLLG